MSRWRFAALLVALGAVVAAASFAAGVALLDDPGPDDPPGRGAATDGPADDSAGTTTPSSDTTSTTALGDGGATWIAVVSSEGDEASAAAVAADVGDAGLPAGVLRSDDHESLTPGFWVAYAGPYPTAAEAEAATATLADEGWTGAYTRCVGTAEQCS